MTSTPRLPNGQPPAEKMPGAKPSKAKRPKKIAAPKAVTSKPMETAKPAPVQAKPAPAMPMPAKFAMLPVPAFESAIDSFERSCKAAGQGAQVFNAKLFDMARTNVTSGFDFMASLAAARDPSDIVRLQMSYWDGCLRTLFGQAQELRALSADIVAKASGPLRTHIERSLKAA